MNVQPAWLEGITGVGVVVTILDDGLEKDHPDLFRNYVSTSVCSARTNCNHTQSPLTLTRRDQDRFPIRFNSSLGFQGFFPLRTIARQMSHVLSSRQLSCLQQQVVAIRIPSSNLGDGRMDFRNFITFLRFCHFRHFSCPKPVHLYLIFIINSLYLISSSSMFLVERID